MPNWCNTTMTVIGPKDDIMSFVNGVQKEDGELMIIKTYMPCPKDLYITSTETYEEIPHKWNEFVKDGTWTQEEYDRRVSENNELLARQKENIAKYGVKDWYDWQYINWGTKWGDCHTEIVDPPREEGGHWMVSYNFQTAWGTATKAWCEISRNFPRCLFRFDSDEEAGFFAGVEYIAQGNVVFENYYEPSGYPEEVDWDDDDQVEKFYKWKDDQADVVDKAENEFLASFRGLSLLPTTDRVDS